MARDPDPLRELARDVYAEHGYTEHGIECLCQRITNDPALLALTVGEVSDYLLRGVQHQARVIISRAPVEHRETSASNRDDIKKATSRFLKLNPGDYFSWPLMDGTLLGDADRGKVEAEAERYKKNADGNRVNELFHRKVAAGLTRNRVVRRAFSQQQLSDLYHEAEEQVRSGVAS